MAYRQKPPRLFDRVCVFLRPGDATVIRANCPGGLSHWVREVVAAHCDELIAEQRRRAKAQAKVLAATINDLNL